MKNYGLDLYEGVVRDNKKAGVFEPAISKVGNIDTFLCHLTAVCSAMFRIRTLKKLFQICCLIFSLKFLC